MKKRTKWTVAGAIGLAVLIIGVTSAMKGRNKATEVRIEKVQRRDLVASVTASGQVQPHTKVDISADISGRIVRLAVKEGQMVTAGQFLLEIDPSQYRASVERAVAAVASAKAQAAQSKPALLQAQRNYDRLAALKKANPTLVSDEQIEQLRTQVDVNEAELEAANHAIDQANASLRDAQSLLSKTTIVAPMSGRVTRLSVEQGETAIQGTFNKDAATMLTISDMSVLETKVKVDETDVSRIKIGDSTVVQLDAFPDTTFVGRVTDISNSSVKAASTGGTGGSTDQAIDYEVTIQLLNAPPETRPDFSATAKIITSIRNNVLSIPIIALTVREDSVKPDTALTLAKRQPTKQVGKRDVEGVFVVGSNNKVAFRPVKVGIAGEKFFEVVNGLKEGENIVGGTYQAIRELKDGATVRAQKEQPKKPGDVAKS
ncbi:MAG TPA: efflux RND transporter periplasmic adaptor subunit [Gemmatimonadaceae bacterium]|jgi:HlyD family secretion protein|nr:efflux RND transporter periplasmic adaptor subunit [Gemmatimonadaceae bacterium]